MNAWISAAACLLVALGGLAMADDATPVIFDTDIGNDVDDVLALGMLHALETRGECRLLAVTISKDNALAAPFVDAVNTFYGRGGIPIGVVRGSGVTPEDGKFLPLAQATDGGAPRYPHDLRAGTNAPDATRVLRQTLARAKDASVAMVQVGFSTNLAMLLESAPDDASPLSGHELVAKKVKVLSLMAGAFRPMEGNAAFEEYNVAMDVASCRKLGEEWPTPMVWSGFEIGIALPYPAVSMERDYRYAAHHPLYEAYQLYDPLPHERPTWDLTAVLWAVRPHHNYFSLSTPGTVTVGEKGATTFTAAAEGKHRYLVLEPAEAPRIREALAQLSSQPPGTKSAK